MDNSIFKSEMAAAIRSKTDGKPLGIGYVSKQFIFRQMSVWFEYQCLQEIIDIFVEGLISNSEACQSPASRHRTSRQNMHDLMVFPNRRVAIEEFSSRISMIIIIITMSNPLWVDKVIFTRSKSRNIVACIEVDRHFGLSIWCFGMSRFRINVDSIEVDFCMHRIWVRSLDKDFLYRLMLRRFGEPNICICCSKVFNKKCRNVVISCRKELLYREIKFSHLSFRVISPMIINALAESCSIRSDSCLNTLDSHIVFYLTGNFQILALSSFQDGISDFVVQASTFILSRMQILHRVVDKEVRHAVVMAFMALVALQILCGDVTCCPMPSLGVLGNESGTS